MHVLEVLDDDLGVELSPKHGNISSYLVQVMAVLRLLLENATG